MSKPTVLPEWATTLITDGTTGELNRAEPSSGKKASGFIPYNTKPSRQDVNWLSYTTFKWLEWLDNISDQEVKVASNVVFASVTSVINTSSLNGISGSAIKVNNTLNLRLNPSAYEPFSLDPSTGIMVVPHLQCWNDIQCDDMIIATSMYYQGVQFTGNFTKLNSLMDGSDIAPTLHSHSVENLNDTTATGPQLNVLTASGDASSLHWHGRYIGNNATEIVVDTLIPVSSEYVVFTPTPTLIGIINLYSKAQEYTAEPWLKLKDHLTIPTLDKYFDKLDGSEVSSYLRITSEVISSQRMLVKIKNESSTYAMRIFGKVTLMNS